MQARTLFVSHPLLQLPYPTSKQWTILEKLVYGLDPQDGATKLLEALKDLQQQLTGSEKMKEKVRQTDECLNVYK